MKKIASLLLATALALGVQSARANLLYDGNFDAIGAAYSVTTVTMADESFYTGTPVAGWQTTHTGGTLELWGPYMWLPSLAASPPPGSTYYAEMNAYEVSSLYQIVTAPDSSAFDISFWHRGREGTDTAGLTILGIGNATSWIPGTGTILYQTVFSTANTGWVNYSANDIVSPVSGQNYVMVFDSISAVGGSPALGNLIGDVRFGAGEYNPTATQLTEQSFALPNAVPEPGTWAAAALLVGGAGFMRWRKRMIA